MQTLISNFLDELEPLLVSPLQPVADDQFDRLARCLFKIQFEQVPPYRALCQAHGLTPGSLRDWSDIPAVPTASFKEFDWTSLRPADRTTVFHSSGTTTAATSRHFHDEASLAVYEKSLLAGCRSWLLRDQLERLDLLFLTPGPGEAPRSSLVHMFETVRRTWQSGSARFVGCQDAAGRWNLASDEACPALTESQSHARPVALFGTAFTYVELLERLAAARSRFSLPSGSRLLETGGYKGRSREWPKSELYAQLSRALGIPTAWIVSEYGMCELGSQAYDHQAGANEPASGRAFQFPPWVRAFPINPETGHLVRPGETGLLRVFDLANVRSVMAIQTEDLVRQVDGGFALFGRAAAAEARGCSLLSR